MDYETMRLECLRLATQQGLKGDEAIAAAERMMKFARSGETNLVGGGKAKVVGRDSDMDKPFKDYLQRDTD
jgi:hypothetical protein